MEQGEGSQVAAVILTVDIIVDVCWSLQLVEKDWHYHTSSHGPYKETVPSLAVACLTWTVKHA